MHISTSPCTCRQGMYSILLLKTAVYTLQSCNQRKLDACLWGSATITNFKVHMIDPSHNFWTTTSAALIPIKYHHLPIPYKRKTLKLHGIIHFRMFHKTLQLTVLFYSTYIFFIPATKFSKAIYFSWMIASVEHVYTCVEWVYTCVEHVYTCVDPLYTV